ncbi:MAG: 1-deoxy-D-xylulose-5-phosphate synthase [Rickettsiales bacterium]|nr:1-deoxy-D-xylulose-5-phosphate synthase [Rickettsiales bacterium]
MTNNQKNKLLDKVNIPADLKKFDINQIKQLADELREATINSVSQTGGHLGAGLGVVELTCALHYVFNTPNDKLIWDVGHQAYPHKILTGRKNKITTIRQANGLSGFTKRSESIYDPFGAGHSSTSISAALGMLIGKKINKQKSNIISIIGDGAMSAGMAFEAMNNAGALNDKFYQNNRLIVILNDNDMSIAPPTGAFSNYLSKLVSSKSYLKIRDFSKKIVNKLPQSIGKYPRKFEKAAKDWWMGGNIFEELGFYYIGPIDGHNLDILIPILQNIRDDNSCDPILIHLVTEKGKGYNNILKSSDKLHAVTKFDPKTGQQISDKSPHPSYSKIFGQKLTNLAQKDKKITAITAAMPSGTGLDIFAKKHPTRFFDVGIAEQHAVTFAAGMACENLKPFIAIYSTFLQRAYDQIIHDVAIQQLPVKFCIDRAGFVGADGPTHAGSFDIAYLINLPNFILMAPSCAQELIKMINTANNINDKPCAIRYPRGQYQFDINYDDNEILEIGKSKIIQKGQKIALLSYGSILNETIKAANLISKNHQITPTIIDIRFAKPFDDKLIKKLVKDHKLLLSIEEGVIGGFGSALNNYLNNNNLLDNCQFSSIFMKDEFIEHDSQENMQKKSEIDSLSIYNKFKKFEELFK